jgi:hypothetical protein
VSANFDLRVAKAFALQGQTRIEVTFDAFNLFNKINYTQASNQIYTVGGTAAAPTLVYIPTFGNFTNANSGTFAPRPREIQLGVRVNF